MRDSLLVVGGIPYVDARRTVKVGTLVSELSLSGDRTAPPNDHTVYFAGDAPCNAQGEPLPLVANSVNETRAGVAVNLRLSHKPVETGRYSDYYEKITAYAGILWGAARVIDPNVTPMTFPVVPTTEEESVFLYQETASSRAGIAQATERLEVQNVAIVGLGGTGSYILDFLAKTPIRQIHLYDGDRFLNHNAFRSPGAASLADLQAHPYKTGYFESIYGRMRRGIVAHDLVTEANVDELREMDFVFIAVDNGDARQLIVSRLLSFSVPFADVGMGVDANEDTGGLSGLVRVTCVTPEMTEHVARRIPMSDGGVNNDYSRNIQIAELNALNAAMAVIKWKKHVGFYADPEREHHSVYQIDGNVISNDERPGGDTAR